MQTFAEGTLDYQLAVIKYWQPMLDHVGVKAGDALGTLLLSRAIMEDPEVKQLEPQFKMRPDPEHQCVVEIDYKSLFEHLGKQGRARVQERLRSQSTGRR